MTGCSPSARAWLFRESFILLISRIMILEVQKGISDLPYYIIPSQRRANSMTTRGEGTKVDFLLSVVAGRGSAFGCMSKPGRGLILEDGSASRE